MVVNSERENAATRHSTSSDDRWETVDAVRKAVQDELQTHPNISYKDVESFRFRTHRPKNGIVLNFPDYHYISSGKELAEHADLIESILDDHVSSFERQDIITRTDAVICSTGSLTNNIR